MIFMRQLPSYDSDIATKRQAAEDCRRSSKICWGCVDVKNQKGVVELQRYQKQHPFAQLSGSDNIIAFTTERYNKTTSNCSRSGSRSRSNSWWCFQ
ncbi:putative homoserine dehydrogenase, Aspartate kinase [Helianthus annuus]|nr:putative homoserine dehydrogenase, Aspartate kinase [Helianthus annuus]